MGLRQKEYRRKKDFEYTFLHVLHIWKNQEMKKENPKIEYK